MLGKIKLRGTSTLQTLNLCFGCEIDNFIESHVFYMLLEMNSLRVQRYEIYDLVKDRFAQKEGGWGKGWEHLRQVWKLRKALFLWFTRSLAFLPWWKQRVLRVSTRVGRRELPRFAFHLSLYPLFWLRTPDGTSAGEVFQRAGVVVAALCPTTM